MKTRPMLRVVVPGRNCARWAAGCLASIVTQSYTNWTACVIDDASTDATWRLVKSFGLDGRIAVLRRNYRVGALANILTGIAAQAPNDDDVIVTVDMDDHLAHPGVFARLARVYRDPKVRLTYGQFRQSNGEIGWALPYPAAIGRGYRAWNMLATHLRTFRYQLWRHIRPSDLKDPKTGKPWDMSWDVAFMLPMLEMCAPEAIRCMAPEVLYVYNSDNPESDHRKDREEQKDSDNRIRDLPKYEVLP